MLRIRLTAVVVLATLVWSVTENSGRCQNPLAGFRLFKHVEADPNHHYPLSKSNGPWMIMVATFGARGGRDAAESDRLRQEAFAQAQELVHELRRDYKLEAYTFVRRSDASEGAQGRGVDPRGRPRRMRYQHKPSAEEIAVLVGNYPAVDAAEAERDLRIVKDIEPKVLDLEHLQAQGRRTYQQLVAYRLSQKTITPEQFKLANPATWMQAAKVAKGVQFNNVTREYGPMGSAFITRNPMLPAEETRGPQVDRVVYDMNKDVKHSLLNCPGKYSVQVATFTGAVILDQKRIRELESGKTHMESRLDEAAMRAHQLTEALRLKGYEAYEFHDRGASIVTVGSFESAGTPRADGKLEMNPEMLRIVREFGPDPLTGRPKAIINIPLDLQPAPVLVPQRSLAADYAVGGLLGWR